MITALIRVTSSWSILGVSSTVSWQYRLCTSLAWLIILWWAEARRPLVEQGLVDGPFLRALWGRRAAEPRRQAMEGACAKMPSLQSGPAGLGRGAPLKKGRRRRAHGPAALPLVDHGGGSLGRWPAPRGRRALCRTAPRLLTALAPSNG